MHISRIAVAVALATVASLAGCSSSSQAPSPATATSPLVPAPPADGGYFNDPRDIVARANGAIPCSDLEEAESVGARAQVHCAAGNIVIRVHENHGGVDGQVNLMGLTGGDLLTGQNWTVNAGPEILQAAQEHLGGKIVHVPCQPPECALEPSP